MCVCVCLRTCVRIYAWSPYQNTNSMRKKMYLSCSAFKHMLRTQRYYKKITFKG